MLTFPLVKPVHADVQTECNVCARPLPPSHNTMVNTKIITKAFCPLRPVGCYLPRNCTLYFLNALQKLWFSCKKARKGGARGVFALGGSLGTSALQSVLCRPLPQTRPAATATSSEKQLCPTFSRRWSSRVSHVK